jgi:hypothetical protein
VVPDDRHDLGDQAGSIVRGAREEPRSLETIQELDPGEALQEAVAERPGLGV